MGHLDSGKWVDDDAVRIDAKGGFQRDESLFRKALTADGSSGFKAEPGRYHLYVAQNCPWAHRTVIFRKLKHLESAITVSYADKPKLHGWAFSESTDGAPQPNNGVLYLHEVYSAAKPGYSGRVTVPTLWDKRQRTIVNNESSEIIRMLNTEFNAFTNDHTDYYPQVLRPQIDEINKLTYEKINNGVYRSGFAKTQAAYEEACRALFDALDKCEAILSRQRYLVGERLTEADWRLFPTLVRFDPVYNGHFKCNIRRLADYPNLSNYTRELYQVPGIAETIDIAGIKAGYYGGMPQVNPTGIVPLGPEVNFAAPHDRDRFKKAALDK